MTVKNSTPLERRKERFETRVREENNSQVTGITFEPFDPYGGYAVTMADDEALARALQAEYEAEYGARDRASNSSTYNHAVRPPAYNPNRDSSDEAYARRLASELNGLNAPNQGHYDSTNGGTSNVLTNTLTDAELSRKAVQELQDRELARNLNIQEQNRASTARAHQLQGEPRPNCSIKRMLCYFLPLALVAISAAAVLNYYVFGSTSLPGWMPTPEEFADEDPFQQKSPEETSRWRNNGEGVELTLLNALDKEWHPYFLVAVNEWDNGNPDSLTLNAQNIDPDYTCKVVDHVVKVCNGDYSATKWRGINKLLLEDEYIYASAARMNEYYFNRNDDDQKQYTMCHEIGHGFGLPHTDENFNNPDLGNCMDYTNRPANNRQPDESNFRFLKALYGVVPGSEESATDPATEESVAKEHASGIHGNGKKEKKGGGGSNGRRLEHEGQTDRVPHRVRRYLEDLDDEANRGLDYFTPKNGWELLHKSIGGQAHKKVLGNGFSVQIHFLLVDEE